MKIKFFEKLKPKEELKSFQEWLSIKEIKNDSIVLNNGKALVILKISPINFNLKSQLEQKAILNSYKIFLKNLNSEIQIIISSKKTDVSSHLDEVLKNTKENPQLYEMSKDYIELINNVIEQKGAITKGFYIVIPHSSNINNEILKITESLSMCGNYVEECSKNEVMFLLENYLNKRMMNHVKQI